MTLKYSLNIQIPFHLCDPAGVLFYAHIFTLAHQAYESWVSEGFGSWQNWFNNPEWIAPIKIAQAEYLRPLPAGEETQVQVFYKSMSESSVTLAFEFLNQGQSQARVETTHVFCSRQFKKIPIPEEIKDFFKR